MRTDAATATDPRPAVLGPAAFALALGACVLLLATRGHQTQDERSAAVVNALVLLVNAGLLAAAYLLAGVGIGRPLSRLLSRLRGVREPEATVGRVWLQSALGVGAMLWISHALGMTGALSGPAGLWCAWGTLLVGLVLLADQVVRGPLRPERWAPLPAWSVLAAPGLAVLLVAACSPPMALWLGARSEGGGYDVLSYHLQLPKEWVASASRLWPVEHNVYSFLPSYMEAAYLHVAALTRGGQPHGGSFVAGSGLGVIASQMLHAGMGVLTALFVARFVSVAARNADRGAGTLPPIIAAAIMLSVPWVMVVGSLPYNELGVTAALAGALLVAMERSWSAAARGAGVGLLMGIACSIKPPALFLAAPVAGLFLLFARASATRDRIVGVVAGCIAGTAALGPWLARNWLAAGNPVFPFAGAVFGTSHWTREQMDRYAGAHRFDGSLGERLSLLFDSQRGVLNEQWAILFPLGAIALAALVARRRTRRIGVLLLAGVLIQIAAWMFLTHLQSRFLLPCVVPLAAALGLGAGELIAWVGSRTAARGPSLVLRRLAMVVAALIPLSLAGWSWLVFVSQRAGSPNQLLAMGGVGVLTGEAFAAEFAQLPGSERPRALENIPPAPYINFTLAPDEAVYFIGNATPLYFVPQGGVASIVYHTTWDRNPLGDAIRGFPDDPRAWTEAVRAAARGKRLDLVLVDFNELGRLVPQDGSRDVWYDPAVTPPVLQRWLREECEPVHAWPTGEGGGVYLFRLRPAAGDAP